MSLPASGVQAEKSTTSDSAGATRLEQAQERFRLALERVEVALASRVKSPVTSSEDSKLIGVLREEIEELRQNNSVLNDANKSALTQVEMTIGRLKGLVEA
jgi:hypothetical protein